MLAKSELIRLYLDKGLSVPAISIRLGCSEHKVNYWLSKHEIQKRSISNALYLKWNPNGDPFSVQIPKTVEEGVLYGLGIGLYWGEGTKASKTSVKLGNTDPELMRVFLAFLQKFYKIDSKRLRFGLQIFSDMDVESSVRYWVRTLGISRKQFYPKIIVTPYRGVGNYRKKTKYGVLSVYFNNRKLRDIICGAIEMEAMRNKPM